MTESAAYRSESEQIREREGSRPEQARAAASGSIGDARRPRTAISDSVPMASAATHQRMTGAERRPFEQAEYDGAQAKDGEPGAAPVDPGGPGRIAALIHEPDRQDGDDDRERHVQEEHGAPADVFDQPAAGDRADRRRDRAESRPGPDRPPALGIVERGTDDREAARNEEGGAEPLERAADDQRRCGGGQAAEDRRRREEGEAGEEHPPAPELVTQRAADQNQPAQEQRVGFDDPLHLGDRRAGGPPAARAARR